MAKNHDVGIIFLSGAGLGSWIWDDIIKGLEVPTIVTDYTDVRSDSTGASLDDYVQAAISAADQLNAGKLIIVAHSIGGVVGIEAAKQLHERVVGFIGVCAMIPKPGDSFFSSLPFPQKFLLPVITSLFGTTPPASALRQLATGLDESTVDKTVQSFTPEAKKLYTDKTSSQPLPDTAYTYIRTKKDNELPLSVQDTIIRRLPGVTTVDMQSSHLPMLTNSSEVLGVIRRLLT